jgi:hypothetical protein
MFSLTNKAFLLAVIGLGVITHAVPMHLDTQDGLAILKDSAAEGVVNPLHCPKNPGEDGAVSDDGIDGGSGTTDTGLGSPLKNAGVSL